MNSPEATGHQTATSLAWEDLILGESVMDGVLKIRALAEHRAALSEDWGSGKRRTPGLCALFNGPSGTGKTLAACLLGQATGRDVVRLGLAQVLSKYIGETEKHLARVFDQAEGQNGILLIDEADALLGKRSPIAEAHDRFAHAEVSYLLQRIEDFAGIVILETNRPGPFDDAFVRRLHASVFFPPPSAPERLRLWQTSLPPGIPWEESVDLRAIAQEHEVTGGQIVNVVRDCLVRAAERGEKVIRLEDLHQGIARELAKAGAEMEAIEKP